MLLLELFKSAPKVEWLQQSSWVSAKIFLKNDKLLHVKFYPFTNELLGVAFKKVDKELLKNVPAFKGTEVMFSVDRSTDLTGDGNEFEVFAAVIHVIQEYVKKHQLDVITFVADSDQRAKLYDKLLSRFVKQEGWRKLPLRVDDHHDDYYLGAAKDPNVVASLARLIREA